MRILACLLLCFAFTACTTPSQRADRDRALFESYPSSVQSQILAGEVAIGFDQDQVRMALGAPDRERTRETQAGREIVWEYTRRSPGVGLSVGGGTGGVGGGVGVSSRGRTELTKRVIFDRDTTLVSEVESFR